MVMRDIAGSFDTVCFKNIRYLGEALHHGAKEVKQYLLVFQHEAIHANRAISDVTQLSMDLPASETHSSLSNNKAMH